jgi:hypothetical protein
VITSEQLNAYLELWARWVLADAQALRGLWYPSATPEHRWARRGGVLSAPPVTPLAPDCEAAEQARHVDRVMGRLRQYRQVWFAAVLLYYVGDPARVNRHHYYAARRWLRRQL